MRHTNRVLITALAVLLLLTLLPAAPAEAGQRHHRSHISIRIDPFWWGWGHAWGYYYGPYYPRRYYPVAEALTTRDVGAVDLNVRPKKADVYIDGELAGKADRFDGFPGYLWLDAGDHQLVLVLDGYQTVAKTIEVRGGSLTDLRVRLESGESTPASDYTVERSSRRSSTTAAPAPYSRGEREAIEGRARHRREGRGSQPPAPLDARAESARLKVEVTPGDASVYLDGRFLGTVADLQRLHSGILVDPGEHTLSAVRPGYEESELEFEAVASEEVVLRIDLQPEVVD